MGDRARREILCGDEVHTARLECGTTLIVAAKPGFARTYGAVAARYGSFDRTFRRPGFPARATPDGSAHFLEHALFEGRSGNALDAFSRRGSLINAATSYRATTYYFTAVEDFAAQLAMLIGFVRTPHFTEASVAKERGIIRQEIRMYDDRPDVVQHRLLMGALFARHPIGAHIAGTCASIALVTPSLLQECFDAFYRPENLAVIAVGDLDFQAVRAVAEDAFAAPPPGPRAGAPAAVFEDETGAAADPAASRRMSIGCPKIAVGYKETRGAEEGAVLVARRCESDFLCEMLFGRGSSFFARLYENGVVDESFSAYGAVYPRIGCIVAAADTPRPAQFIAAVEDAAAHGDESLVEEDFARARRKFEGELLRRCNAPESVASLCLGAWVDRAGVLEALETLRRVTLADVRTRARAVFAPEGRAVAAVLPHEWEGEPAWPAARRGS
ncbi:MAG TPA: pitrilysin family protein [Planctomycetota bacterium]|mgnify:CR=1 FL=1|nr:insulinase family protein [Planctomycetota bacterium]OQC22292.1 MAG: putative zinc protease AlbF [Planctomycetes bacterium ADurb.Bin069]HNS00505.1 pitrilysin family protein [Planctomycetota bacterium]HNU25873.1 pitrilysin family protein [Planctomycetota bacterium]HOE29257.1 pitrilysin family protein [Planctomycetota bacterium]